MVSWAKQLLQKRRQIGEQEDPETGFKNLPPGWTRQSVRDFVRSLTGRTEDEPEGLFTECVDRMQDEEGFDEEGAKRFCAALKDEFLGTELWRGGS